eukprot:RCo012408
MAVFTSSPPPSPPMSTPLHLSSARGIFGGLGVFCSFPQVTETVCEGATATATGPSLRANGDVGNGEGGIITEGSLWGFPSMFLLFPPHLIVTVVCFVLHSPLLFVRAIHFSSISLSVLYLPK